MAHSSDPDTITFSKLETRLLDANNNIDSSNNYKVLDSITDVSVNIGSGGSYPAAIFSSKVLTYQGLPSFHMTPRDAMYNVMGVKNLIAYSWGGRNYAVKRTMLDYQNPIVAHASSEQLFKKEIRFYYEGMDKEKSFISEADTLIPMGELLKYYLHSEHLNEKEYLNNIIRETFNTTMDYDVNSEVFEIMTGDDTNVSAHILESTMTESGIGIPLLHEKYDYCHGRSVTSSTNRGKHTLIYLLNQETELDRTLLELIPHNYKNVITLRSDTKERIVGEYILSLKSVLLCNHISQIKKRGLSQVDYDPTVVKKLYRYQGDL